MDPKHAQKFRKCSIIFPLRLRPSIPWTERLLVGEFCLPLFYNENWTCNGFVGEISLRPLEAKRNKHNYDPIGTWEKYKPTGPQNVKRRIVAHFVKKALWPPQTIRDVVGRPDL